MNLSSLCAAGLHCIAQRSAREESTSSCAPAVLRVAAQRRPGYAAGSVALRRRTASRLRCVGQCPALWPVWPRAG